MTMGLSFLILFFQLPNLDTAPALRDAAPTRSWAELAEPWMLAEELALYRQLDESDQKKFQGFFTARRDEQPDHWPETGLFLPCFFYPKYHGDIRDRILYIMGDPKKKVPNPANRSVPSAWRYDDLEIQFVPSGGGQVKLAETALPVWEQIKARLVLHPEIVYDFHKRSFGRTRLPEDITWVPVNLTGRWLTPSPGGSRLRVTFQVPEDYRREIRAGKSQSEWYMECLLSLDRMSADRNALNYKPQLIRHSARLVDFQKEFLHFDFDVPEGYFQADFQIYSGFLHKGLKTEMRLFVPPRALPRIGTPMISQEREAPGLEAPDHEIIQLSDGLYRLVGKYDAGKPAHVLVTSNFPDTSLLLQVGDRPPQPLELFHREQNWFVFLLPAQKSGFRLIARAETGDPGSIALSVWGPQGGRGASIPSLSFEKANHPNYLELEQLSVGGAGPETWLFVNEQPLLASRTGRFFWPAIDWGEQAQLRFETEVGGSWGHADFTMKRDKVFREISVTPGNLVVGVRQPDGKVIQETAREVEVFVAGNEIPTTTAKGLGDTTKLWGIVVNEPLLGARSWSTIKEALREWLKTNIGPQDYVYLVRIAHRPRLILQPTNHKATVLAALEALIPESFRPNYFNLEYLIDEFTHLDLHHKHPHQVMLFTNQLTEELSQIEALLPYLRTAGLQIYNLEFPFEAKQPSSGLPELTADEKALAKMETEREEYQRGRGIVRDNHQDDRKEFGLFKLNFNRGKSKKKSEDEALKREALREGLNTQLAGLTAGISRISPLGELRQTLNDFFMHLTQWQSSLVHIKLPAVADVKQVEVKAPPGRTVSWTLVEWEPSPTTPKTD